MDSLAFNKAFGVEEITSAPMKNAISQWFRLYYAQGEAAGEDTSPRVAYAVVRMLSRAVFSEYSASCDDAFGAGVVAALNRVAREAVQLALIGGLCLLKPVPEKEGFRFVPMDRRNFWIFGRNGERLTDVGSARQVFFGDRVYTLLERRQVDGEGFLTLSHKLYESSSPYILGQEVPLDTVEQFAALPERYTFPVALHSVGLISVATPMVNCVDGSGEPVSVFAPAVGLIRGLNRNEQELCDEFRRGKSRLVVSADLLRRDAAGNRSLQDDVFVGLDDDPEQVGITIFSPELREQSYLARKQDYLRSIESVLGLKRGMLSQVEASPRTAREITSSEGDYSLTIQEFQKMWEGALQEAVALCRVLGQMYRLPDAPGEGECRVDWGNGILFDTGTDS